MCVLGLGMRGVGVDAEQVADGDGWEVGDGLDQAVLRALRMGSPYWFMSEWIDAYSELQEASADATGRGTAGCHSSVPADLPTSAEQAGTLHRPVTFRSF